jgi:hypothetical protein
MIVKDRLINNCTIMQWKVICSFVEATDQSGIMHAKCQYYYMYKYL